MIIVIHVIGPAAGHGHGGGVATPRRLVLVPAQELREVQGLTLLLSSFLALTKGPLSDNINKLEILEFRG